MTQPPGADAPVSPGTRLTALTVDGTVVATYWDGAALPPTLAPRPFLHPVTTLSGTPVTDAQPGDHPWHLGVSVAVQDVGGTNVWGGPTFRSGKGYTWLDDHGREVHDGWDSRDGQGFVERLQWQHPDGRRVLTERRAVRGRPATEVPGGWVLDLAFTLQNATTEPLYVGSPATNGRAGAGYGGLFWRLPSAEQARVYTRDREGEDAVHGTRATWVAMSSADNPGFTVALAGLDDRTRQDPWFVRVSDYPGLGSQLAATRPVLLAPGETLSRGFRAVVSDGTPDQAVLERELLARVPD